jgi:hypothetical protein
MIKLKSLNSTFKILLFVYLISLVENLSYAQRLSITSVWGTYRNTYGTPGKTVKYADGSEVKICPMVYQEEILKLKPFGCAKKIILNPGNKIYGKEKLKWKHIGDTLILSQKNSSNAFKYRIDFSRENIIYLLPLDTSKMNGAYRPAEKKLWRN